MTTLQDRLDRIRDNFAKQAPETARSVMGRATQELHDSGILDRVPKVGDALPPFALPDTEGQTVSSFDLLAAGPLVVTVYRGIW